MAFATKCSFLLLVMLAITVSTEDTESTFSKIKEISTTITNEVTYLPPMIVLGKPDGDIIRCPFATPTSCETYYVGSSAVTATLVHGEYLFAALASGSMLRCLWHRSRSCQVFYQAGSKITGLAVTEGYIHIGIQDGTILQCKMNTPNSCEAFANIGNGVASLAASSSIVYAGSSVGRIYRCDISGNCSLLCHTQSSYEITGLTVIGNKIYGLTSNGYIKHGDVTSKSCDSFSLRGYPYGAMAVYNSKLYAVREDIKEFRTYVPGSGSSTAFASHSGGVSISFAYGTYAMQEKYRIESVKCIWTGIFKCPPTVFYYDDVKRRSALEISVKDGKLYDSQGVVVDTSNADESHSQKAAIFAMGPDGQILLSNVHKPGLLHTSSLFAGNPVSGAGLVVVEQGKIMNVTACSVHYRPDQELNDQVREALRTKGYTDSINFHPCSYNDMLCVFDGTGTRKLE